MATYTPSTCSACGRAFGHHLADCPRDGLRIGPGNTMEYDGPISRRHMKPVIPPHVLTRFIGLACLVLFILSFMFLVWLVLSSWVSD